MKYKRDVIDWLAIQYHITLVSLKKMLEIKK